MPVPPMLTPDVRAHVENIARLTAKGMEPEQIRQVTDLDVIFIRRIQALDEFEPALRKASPEAATLWQESKSSEQARKRVKIAAREDAPEHYQMARDIVRQGAGLSEKDRLQALFKLLDISGVADETVEEETIALAPSQLALIADTLKETFGNRRPDA